MAKRRRKTHSRRRSRVGAASLNPKNPMILLASVAAGYLAGDQIYKAIDKAIPTKDTSATDKTQVNVVSDTVLGAGVAGVGALLALKGKKTMIKTVAGGVMAGAGLKWILKDQGVISGFASMPAIGRRGVRGFAKVPAIGAYTPNRTAAIGQVPASLRGVPAALKGGMGAYTPNRMPSMAGIGL